MHRLPDPYEFRPLPPGVALVPAVALLPRREKPETLRTFRALISQEACSEPLRVPIGIFEADPVEAYRKAYRQIKIFYGSRFLKFA